MSSSSEHALCTVSSNPLPTSDPACDTIHLKHVMQLQLFGRPPQHCKDIVCLLVKKASSFDSALLPS